MNQRADTKPVLDDKKLKQALTDPSVLAQTRTELRDSYAEEAGEEMLSDARPLSPERLEELSALIKLGEAALRGDYPARAGGGPEAWYDLCNKVSEARRKREAAESGTREVIQLEPMKQKVEVGNQVAYVDEVGILHPALVTAVWEGEFGSAYPGLNMVVVDQNDKKQDEYGRQIRRECSVPHKMDQKAHGKFWKF